MVFWNGDFAQEEWQCANLCGFDQAKSEYHEGTTSVTSCGSNFGPTKVFAKLDANSGFWKKPLLNDSALLTSFLTPHGRFCFHRLPFGITSAPEHLQRRMSEILKDCEGTVCMMDGVLVYGSTQEDCEGTVCMMDGIHVYGSTQEEHYD